MRKTRSVVELVEGGTVDLDDWTTPLELCGKHSTGRESFRYYTGGTYKKYGGVIAKSIYGWDYCPECLELQKKSRRCLRCEKPFKPGCKFRFVCIVCREKNGRSYEGENV